LRRVAPAPAAPVRCGLSARAGQSVWLAESSESGKNERVAAPDRRARVARRTAKAGLTPPPELLDRLDAYLDLLARWNERINLTGLPVNPLTDDAVDRLVVEPLEAARHVRPTDGVAVDVGSGGGSPAIPLKLARPDVHMILVESKVRKAAFLREAIRGLGLDGIEVANCRFEAFESAPVPLVTVRAVRLDLNLVMGITSLLEPAGRLFWFRSNERKHLQSIPGLEFDAEHRLLSGAVLSTFVRRCAL
jgi:16S rRNA (guanine527-N7)-methyltransferase